MSEERSHDSPAAAIGFINFGILSGVGLDFVGKWLLAAYPLPQFVLLRSLFGALVLLSLVGRFGGLSSLKTGKLAWHLLRTLLATGAMFGFFFGLSRIPLVDAFTISFIAPLLTTALAALLLGDSVGWRRWLAVGCGFAGVLLVLRPGAGVLSWPALAVVAAAVCYAGLAITSRRLAGSESSLALSIYVLIGPMLLATIWAPGNWLAPTPIAWLGFLAAGVCSAGAWIGIVGAYRRASPAILAPFEYTALIWAAVGGYLIWDEVPDIWVLAGGALIVGSGLFVAYREIGRFTAPSRYLRVLTTSGAAKAARERRESAGRGDGVK